MPAKAKKKLYDEPCRALGEPATDPELDALVRGIIARVADRWTMLTLEVLADHGRMRFGRLTDLIGDVSQKMLTKTLRQMEADGLVTRTVYPVVPPRVEYELTPIGLSLGAAFCSVWQWAETHRADIEAARAAFEKRAVDEG
ncbi:MAG TPA: helix-turn-helix domain-containing protein [Luteibacter sp.]|nr:helix-turn-helix domain-containing protein [Luteibacter sp.]